MVNGPYREGGGELECPRCQVQMLARAGGLACEANQCGEWWSKDALVPTIDWGTVELCEPFLVFGAAAPDLPCPACKRRIIMSM
jgi:hypothetical protein